jgi:hypothetical protein
MMQIKNYNFSQPNIIQREQVEIVLPQEKNDLFVEKDKQNLFITGNKSPFSLSDLLNRKHERGKKSYASI